MTEKTIEEQLSEAIDQHEEGLQEEPSVSVEPDIEEPEPEIEAAEETPEEKPPAIDPPHSWTPDAKKDWPLLPAHIQAEIVKRENDTHKMFTSRDGDLRLGKDMKEVLEPYMPVFRETGVEPKALVHELLGTVNTLRNGTEEQKIMVLRNIADGYEVDLQKVLGYQNNPLNALYGELNSLKQQVNPQNIIKQLQDQQETARIQSEYEAFAENKANVHLEKAKPYMAALFEAGLAKSFQEAYDAACNANPEIRSTMQASLKTEDAAKRKTEIAQKKNAAVSIKGSSSLVQGNEKPPIRTLEEEIAANIDAIRGSKI
jgi:predicted transcriptional regulator